MLWLVVGCDKPAEPATRAVPAGATSAATSATVVVEAFPAGFTSASAQVNGTTLHYVVGGQGPAPILIHGFPENWSAFATIMPGLASKFRVVAVDLRGIGGSTPVQGDHETATMAEDVYQLTLKLGLDRTYVVGHDISGGVAYAIARLHPDAIRGAMISDVPIPGVDPWDQVMVNPAMWHFGFHHAPAALKTTCRARSFLLRPFLARQGRRSKVDQRRGDFALCPRLFTTRPDGRSHEPVPRDEG